MKKIVAIILGLVFLASMTCSFAEEEPFYAGVYRVGKDFKPGNYNIRVTKTGRDTPEVFIDIYENDLKYANKTPLTMHDFSEEGYHLYVTEGMVFELEVFDCVLSIVNETPSWMIQNK